MTIYRGIGGSGDSATGEDVFGPNSSITNLTGIDGAIQTPTYIRFDPNAGHTALQGDLTWNLDEGTLDVGLNGGAAVLQVGQEQHYRVLNQTGLSISNGTLVMYEGTDGNSGKLRITPWDGIAPTQTIMGITTEDIANGSNGYVTCFGKVRGIQTDGANYSETWVDGDILYAGSTGGLTKTLPQAPSSKTSIAVVVNSHVSNGALFVRVQHGSDLNQDELVQLTTLTNGDVLQYDSIDGRFENRSLTTAGIQPLDTSLSSISGLTTVADRMIYTTAPDIYDVTPITAFGRSLVDDDTASTARGTLGLGSLATLGDGDYGDIVVSSSGASWELDSNVIVDANVNTTAAIESSKLQFTSAGAVTRTVQSKLREFVSVKDFGAVGDGVTDDTVALQTAISEVVDAGGGYVYVPHGDYLITAQVINNGAFICGDGDSTRFIVRTGLPSPITNGNLFVSGSIPNVATAIPLASNAVAGDTSRVLQVNVGGGASFTVGSYAVIYSSINSLPGSDVKDAEYVYIDSIVGDTLTIRSQLLLSYTTANSAKLLPITLTKNVGYKNFQVIMDDTYDIPDPATVSYMFMASAIYARFCENLLVENVSCKKAVSAAVLLIGCVNASCTGLRPTDLYSDTFDKPYAGGYGVCERALNYGTVVTNLVATRCRTAYTTVASPTGEFPYGHPTNSIVSDGIHWGSKSTGWDTHGTGINVTFSNLKAIGARRAGFQARSYRMNVLNVEAMDCGGSAVAVFGGGSSNAAANDVYIKGVRSRNTNTYNGVPIDINDRDWRITGAIHVGCETATIEDVNVDNCGGQLITESSACLYPEYRRIRAKRVRSLANGTRAIETGASASSTPIFEDVFLSDSPNVVDLVYRVNFSSGVRLKDVKATGITGKVFTSVTGEAGVLISGGYGAETYSSVQQNKALVADELSLVGVRTQSVNITPESGTVDSLSKITGAVTGAYIEVWGTSGNSFTIIHGTGTDNLYLRGATNVVLGVNQAMAFRKKGSLWYEIWRTF